MCDRSLMITVEDIKQVRLDTTLKCLDECHEMREWWQACGAAELKACKANMVLDLGLATGTFQTTAVSNGSL